MIGYAGSDFGTKSAGSVACALVGPAPALSRFFTMVTFSPLCYARRCCFSDDATYCFGFNERMPPFPRFGVEPGRPESVTSMARICCLAAVNPKDIPLLGAALKSAAKPSVTIVARLDVAALGRLAPDILVADIDKLEVDPLEMLRQLRFVLPDCLIVVYTAVVESSWGRACHLAGASCMLSKESHESQLMNGLLRAIHTGCFTDPSFA
jgi:CheY-like chemotaxis protein